MKLRGCEKAKLRERLRGCETTVKLREFENVRGWESVSGYEQEGHSEISMEMESLTVMV